MHSINGVWVKDPSESVVSILEKGSEYHEGMIDLAVSLCSSKRTFLDVGACFGLITQQMSPYAERVLAFEPNQEILPCLRKNTESLRNVEILEYGASNKEESKRLVLYNNSGRSTYRDVPIANLLKHRSTLRVQDTKTLTIDSLNLKDVDLIKLDVEGYEKSVLQGSFRTIARSKPVIIAEQKEGSEGSRFIPAALSLLGYQVHSVFREKDYVYVHQQGSSGS